mgnify:CR=1 FL=1|jgi:hypothetical protein
MNTRRECYAPEVHLPSIQKTISDHLLYNINLTRTIATTVKNYS